MLSSDSRASSLLRGSASRKLATDRDMHMTLWKNYVVMGCCIAPPSHTLNVHTTTSTDYRCVTPELTTMSVYSLCHRLFGFCDVVDFFFFFQRLISEIAWLFVTIF